MFLTPEVRLKMFGAIPDHGNPPDDRHDVRRGERRSPKPDLVCLDERLPAWSLGSALPSMQNRLDDSLEQVRGWLPGVGWGKQVFIQGAESAHGCQGVGSSWPGGWCALVGWTGRRWSESASDSWSCEATEPAEGHFKA